MKAFLLFSCLLIFDASLVEAQPFTNISVLPGLPELLICPPPKVLWDPYEQKCICDPTIQCPKRFKLDQETCDCTCMDACSFKSPLCLSPQIWSNKSCSCECPQKKLCIGNSYWDANECRCRCTENQVSCCPPRVWDLNSCLCRCPNPISCNPSLPFVWNDVNCACDCIPESKKKCLSEPYHIWYPKPQCKCDCDQSQKPKCLTNTKYTWSPWPKCCNCKLLPAITCISKFYQIWKPFPQCECQCDQAKKSLCTSNWKYSWNPWPNCCDCKSGHREECQKIPYHGLSAFPKCDCVCDPAKKSECIANPNYAWDPSNSQCCDCNQENIEAKIQECYNRPGAGWVWMPWPECDCLQTVG